MVRLEEHLGDTDRGEDAEGEGAGRVGGRNLRCSNHVLILVLSGGRIPAVSHETGDDEPEGRVVRDPVALSQLGFLCGCHRGLHGGSVLGFMGYVSDVHSDGGFGYWTKRWLILFDGCFGEGSSMYILRKEGAVIFVAWEKKLTWSA